jgi:hypothetical protein
VPPISAPLMSKLPVETPVTVSVHFDVPKP